MEALETCLKGLYTPKFFLEKSRPRTIKIIIKHKSKSSSQAACSTREFFVYPIPEPKQQHNPRKTIAKLVHFYQNPYLYKISFKFIMALRALRLLKLICVGSIPVSLINAPGFGNELLVCWNNRFLSISFPLRRCHVINVHRCLSLGATSPRARS